MMVILGYPLVNIQKAIEHGHRNSGFSQLENGGSFQFAMLNYQRVIIYMYIQYILMIRERERERKKES